MSERKELYDIVADVLGKDAFVGARVLDVGCARFAESAVMKDMGATVTGLDVCDRQASPDGIAFVQADFLKWQPDSKQHFDILYLKNSALFMPNGDVFKKIASFGARTIAVRTMYDFPEPNWDASILKPLYFTKPEDWKAYFEPLGFKTLYAETFDDFGPDMRGVSRSFHMTDYIATKVE